MRCLKWCAKWCAKRCAKWCAEWCACTTPSTRLRTTLRTTSNTGLRTEKPANVNACTPSSSHFRLEAVCHKFNSAQVTPCHGSPSFRPAFCFREELPFDLAWAPLLTRRRKRRRTRRARRKRKRRKRSKRQRRSRRRRVRKIVRRSCNVRVSKLPWQLQPRSEQRNSCERRRRLQT